MSIEYRQLNVASINWSATDKSYVPGVNVIFYFYKSAGAIFSLIGDGFSTLQELYDSEYNNIIPRLAHSSKRVVSSERISDVISTSGWYKIAEVTGIQGETCTCNIKCGGQGTSRDSMSGVNVGISLNANSRKYLKLDPETGPNNRDLFTVKRYRLGYSDTTPSAGAILEAYVDVNVNITLISQITTNMSDRTAEIGFELVAPVLTDNLLPDDTTSATYIYPSQELSLAYSQMTFAIGARKISSDAIVLTIPWENICDVAFNTMAITNPSTGWRIVDRAGTIITLSGSITSSNMVVIGEKIVLRWNQTSAFSTLTTGLLLIETNGTGAKLVVSST